MKISFAEQPPIGLAIKLDDQRFDLVGVEDHKKLDGMKIKLMVWQSLCPTCGVAFYAKSTTNRLPDARRCEAHRQPGKPVRRAV